VVNRNDEDEGFEAACGQAARGARGDWRTPNPGWNGFNSRNIIARDPWGSGVALDDHPVYDLIKLAVF
jgi:hypothetical protein